ncbi:MAG TPA: carboxypeptidase-like regulatory domain-containing protein, partial [Puia sp.]
MRRTLPLLFVILLIAGPAALAQQNPTQKTLNLTLSHVHLDSLISRVEAQLPVRFFYDATQFDSLDVDLTVSNAPLDQLLDQLFKNTAYHYAIDEEGNIFLTKGWTIQTGLSPAVSGEPDSARRTTIRFGEEKALRGKGSSESKLYDIGPRTNTLAPGKAVISGVVHNTRTGEPIAGVVISPEPPGVSTVTDRYGYYSISLPRGHHLLNVQGLGLRDSHFQLMLYSDGKMDMDLREQVTTLREVIVSSQKTLNVNRVQLGVEQLNIQQIKQVPTVMGEADILRVVLTLPGVKSVGEASTGLNVRGSSTDQNLILFNDATIYNPSHFFGFFSAFNP